MKIKLLAALLFLMALYGPAGREPELRLKSKGKAEFRTLTAKSMSRRRSHLLLRFAETPTSEQIGELIRRGVSFLRYVPDSGYLVAADNGMPLEDIGIGIEQFPPESKISPILIENGGYLVEFHPDVEPGEATALLMGSHLRILAHPDLVPGHWLVTGALESVRGLAEWDEVAYVFPASPILLRRQRVMSCGGALTPAGTIGQYVATAGDGWDGPGKGAAQIGYYFGQLTGKLPQDTVKTQILQAFQQWSRYIQVTFVPAASASQNRSMNVMFASGAHGDGFNFDGPGGILAHTFYPAPPNPESIAGDMHLDADENWGIGVNTDLFSVVLHETGHALGLGHSDKPGDVMYPYYQRTTGLTADDVAAIRTLYASTGAAIGTTPVTPVTPVTPPPAPRPTPDTTSPSVTISSPSSGNVITAAASIVFQGTATDNVGVTQVTWTTSGGKSGSATGTTNWVTPAIPLYQGSNTVTIRASDAAGNVGWRAVTVTRR